jgi:hypothetical protein
MELLKLHVFTIVVFIGSTCLGVLWLQASKGLQHPGGVRHSSCHDLWEQKVRKHNELMVLRRAIVEAALEPGSASTFHDRTSYDPFEPTYTCHAEYRRGKLFGDGGKFVCGDAAYFKSRNATGSRCLVYSVGSNGDASFEEDIFRNFGCDTHTFDPTGNSTTYRAIVEAAGGRFHPFGVSGAPSSLQNSVTGLASKLLPIREITEMLDHTARAIDIVKIDCEGCEYGAFRSLWPQIQAGTITVGQIQIEMHGTDFAQIAAFFDEADKTGYMVFHKERNHWGCDGYLCLEFSLIHKVEAERVFRFTHCNVL